MSGRKTMRSSSSRSRTMRSKFVTGITEGMIRGNTHGIKWGDVEGLSEERVKKLGFNAALKEHKRMTALEGRYPDWIKMIKANAEKSIPLNTTLRRLRANLSPEEKRLTSHKNVEGHMTKRQKRNFYKTKAVTEAQKEEKQFAEWKKHNPNRNISEFLSLRAIRKFLNKQS